MTPLVVAAALVTAGCAAGLFGIVVWLLLQRRRADTGETEESFSQAMAISQTPFSLERYQPMATLLSKEEFEFLKSMPGYTPAIGAEWKRGRELIFRRYLSELKRDFGRLHAQARTMVAQSDASASGLVGVLLRQQVSFWRALMLIELRLTMRSLGVGEVDVRPLVELVQSMQVDLARFTPQQV